MSIDRRISKLEEQRYLALAARIATRLGVPVEEVLAEADHIVQIGVEVIEAELIRDFNLSREELEAEKAAGRRLVEDSCLPSHN